MTWQPIETAPTDGTNLLLYTEEGITQGQYLDPEPDGIDSMGHDGGWMSYDGYSFPGRSFGNPKYFNEPQGQPTHWQPLPEPPDA